VTSIEMLALPQHSRIKYIGTDVAVLTQLKEQAPASYTTKGLVMVSVYDMTKSSWSKSEGIRISTWNSGYFNSVVPEDWIVLDAKRIDLTRKREDKAYTRADKNVKYELDSFTRKIGDLTYSKTRIDRELKNLPLANKFKILTSLSEDQKVWFDLLSLDAATVVACMKKVVKELTDAEETPCTVTTDVIKEETISTPVSGSSELPPTELSLLLS